MGWLPSTALVFFLKSGYIYWIPLMYKDLGLQPQPFLSQCAKEILQGSVTLHSISRDLWSNVIIQSTDYPYFITVSVLGTSLEVCVKTFHTGFLSVTDLVDRFLLQVFCDDTSPSDKYPAMCWVLCLSVGVGCMKELISLVAVCVRHVPVELSWV